jgi:hypothetical protein
MRSYCHQPCKYSIDEGVYSQVAVHEVVSKEDEDEIENFVITHSHLPNEEHRSQGVVDVKETVVEVFVPPVFKGPFRLECKWKICVLILLVEEVVVVSVVPSERHGTWDA